MKRLFSQFVDPTEVGALRASVEAGNYTLFSSIINLIFSFRKSGFFPKCHQSKAACRAVEAIFSRTTRSNAF